MDQHTSTSSRGGRRLIAGAATVAVALAALGVSAGAVSAQSASAYTITTTSGDAGTYLVGPDGMTLYTFTRDVTPGVSVCNGKCAESWPPLAAEEDDPLVAGEGVTGILGAITRADGSSQATYDGRPLYYFAKDAAAGDTNGQGVGNVWFVAMANGSAPANPSAVTLAVAQNASLGGLLTAANNMTVYRFDNDTVPGQSTCTGDCATKWPPVTVPAGNTAAGGEGATGVVGLIPAADGTWQVTYNGEPLYYFSGDKAEGDTNGQGLNDKWWVVAP